MGWASSSEVDVSSLVVEECRVVGWTVMVVSTVLVRRNEVVVVASSSPSDVVPWTGGPTLIKVVSGGSSVVFLIAGGMSVFSCSGNCHSGGSGHSVPSQGSTVQQPTKVLLELLHSHHWRFFPV